MTSPRRTRPTSHGSTTSSRSPPPTVSVVVLDPIETGSLPARRLQANGATKAFNYGAYLGNRYKNSPNIIWMSGNDFAPGATRPTRNLVLQVMQGIHRTDPNHIQTIEGTARRQLLARQRYVHLASRSERRLHVLPDLRRGAARLQPVGHRPDFMVEANYEGENNTGNDPSTPQVLRRQEYWTMTSGATGQLYGSHYTVGFFSGWQTNLDTTGVTQLRYETCAPRARSPGGSSSPIRTIR